MQPVVFIDSGVGGLPYCQNFHDRMPHVPRIYIADRAHFPYGPREKKELSRILVQLVQKVRDVFEPVVVVLACNTASISSLAELRASFPDIPFVGTVPAIKPAVLASKRKRIGLIATERTISDAYVYSLGKQFDPACHIEGLAAPELVDFVEHRLHTASEDERRGAVLPYIEYFTNQQVDGLVLGCTHFLFLLEEFTSLVPAEMRVYHSLDGVARRVQTFLPEAYKNVTPHTEHTEYEKLLVTGEGPITESWQWFSRRYALLPEVWQ